MYLLIEVAFLDLDLVGVFDSCLPILVVAVLGFYIIDPLPDLTASYVL